MTLTSLIERLEKATEWNGWCFVGASLDGALWCCGGILVIAITLTGEWFTKGGLTVVAAMLLGAILAPLLRFVVNPWLKARMEKDNG